MTLFQNSVRTNSRNTVILCVEMNFQRRVKYLPDLLWPSVRLNYATATNRHGVFNQFLRLALFSLITLTSSAIGWFGDRELNSRDALNQWGEWQTVQRYCYLEYFDRPWNRCSWCQADLSRISCTGHFVKYDIVWKRNSNLKVYRKK